MNSNIYKSFVKREYNGDLLLRFKNKNQVNIDFIRRLDIQKELEGHQGCVNCLTWNAKGDLLASGSDDTQAILWDVQRGRKLHSIKTGHTGNIFSVKFMPETNNTIATGAADDEVRIHQVELDAPLFVITCHSNRVKRLAITPDQPSLLWSASEDGSVMQFDLRDPSTFTIASSTSSSTSSSSSISSSTSSPKCLLIDLKKYYSNAEIKCININPAHSHLLAVGSNDPFVRLYDRRMLTCTSKEIIKDHVNSSTGLPQGCAQYFVAGHLPSKEHDFKIKHRTLASTYVTFSPNGRELLLNLGGEQVYLFDIFNKREVKKVDLIKNISQEKIIKPANGFTNHSTSVIIQPATYTHPNGFRNSHPADLKLIHLKNEAKRFFDKGHYSQAISFYNQALLLDPSSSNLFCNRALALFKRNWDGDIYASLRDCYSSIQLDSNNFKAYFRLVCCLESLCWLDEATTCLELIKLKFNSHQEILQLEKSLEKSLKELEKNKSKIEEGKKFPTKTRSNSFSLIEMQSSDISDDEKVFRERAFDYEVRFCGHCNTTTDIKEATFFGGEGQFVVAGSDDGNFFIWDRKTSNIVRVLHGDESIVNCLAPHPTFCAMATSGIEQVVRLWGVNSETTSTKREVSDSEETAKSNQERMNADPLQQVLLHMGYMVLPFSTENREDTCRTS